LFIILLIMRSIDQYKSLDFIYLFIILVIMLNNLNEMTPNDRVRNRPWFRTSCYHKLNIIYNKKKNIFLLIHQIRIQWEKNLESHLF
jgi:hypothetical protein